MNLEEAIEPVALQLQAAAALGDERTQQIAANLAATVDAAVRLAIIQAVSSAAADASQALTELGGADAPAITAHVDGDDLDIRVTPGTAEQPAPPPPTDDGDAAARISLRLTEALKAEIERAAGSEGLSVNGWLVRAATWALSGRRPPWGGPNRGGGPNWGGGPGWGGPPEDGRGSHRVTGWVTG
jgi:hypothetical protein